MLCWNVYKQNRSHRKFKSFLEQTIQNYPTDFLLFQEARFESDTACILDSFAFDAAANLEYKESFYGVLTAGRILSAEAKAYLSNSREAYWGTHKSMLMSTYTLQNGKTLLIVNIHAINFRENQIYNKEIDRLLAFISDYKGSIIVAGDFNTWNNKRVHKLFSIAESLGLKHVPLGKEENVKTMFGNPLDLVFYRDLELLSSAVLDDGGISDHRPLFASFRIMDEKYS